MASTSPHLGYKKQRPVSTIAINFSAALDDLFNLGTTGELAETIEQKKYEVKTHEQELEQLDARLRRMDEQLKSLQTKHKRMQSEHIPYGKSRGRAQINNGSDSDEQAYSDGKTSPVSDTDRS